MTQDSRVPGVATAAAQIGRDLRDHQNDPHAHGGTNAGGTNQRRAPRVTMNEDGSSTIEYEQTARVTTPPVEFDVSLRGGGNSRPAPGTGYMGAQCPDYGFFGEQIGLGNAPQQPTQPTQTTQSVTTTTTQTNGATENESADAGLSRILATMGVPAIVVIVLFAFCIFAWLVNFFAG